MTSNEGRTEARCGNNGVESVPRELVSTPTELEDMGLVQITLGTSAAGTAFRNCCMSRRVLGNKLELTVYRLALQVPSP